MIPQQVDKAERDKMKAVALLDIILDAVERRNANDNVTVRHHLLAGVNQGLIGAYEHAFNDGQMAQAAAISMHPVAPVANSFAEGFSLGFIRSELERLRRMPALPSMLQPGQPGHPRGRKKRLTAEEIRAEVDRRIAECSELDGDCRECEALQVSRRDPRQVPYNWKIDMVRNCAGPCAGVVARIIERAQSQIDCSEWALGSS